MTDKQPEALRLAEMLTADEWPGSVTLVSYARECVAELRRQHARIAELEAQLEAIRAGGHGPWLYREGGPNRPETVRVRRRRRPTPRSPCPGRPQLLKFYGVTTDAELIAAQARHIERLQAKLPQTPSFAPQQVREG